MRSCAWCSFDISHRVCGVRYLCGGMRKAWVSDKRNIDGGGFDCAARKAALEYLAGLLK